MKVKEKVDEGRKVVVIGLDGATLDIVIPLGRKGMLPTLSSLMAKGVWGELRSTLHPVTPHAWTTFLTGKNAGKHSIYDFTAWKEHSYEMEFVNGSHRKAPTVFSILNRCGKRAGSVAVPFTYPPEEVDGFVLSGIDAPDEGARAVYPESLFHEIKRNVGPYHIHLGSPVGRRRDDSAYIKDILTEDENRTEIGLYLMKKHSTDLFMIVYNNIDRIQHQTLSQGVSEELRSETVMSPDAELVATVYKETDEKVGRIISQVDEDTLVMIMSDHGAGPIRKVFFLDTWLENNGWLAHTKTAKRSLCRSVQGVRFLSKRFLPRWGKNLIKGRMSGLRDRIESYLAFSGIDWDRTKAYGFGMYGNVCINLRGREPGGVVEPGSEYEDLRGEIAERLENLRDPETGDAIVERGLRREEIYEGPYVDKAPDLLIRWRDYSYYTSVRPDPGADGVFGPCQNIDSSEYKHVGTHRMEGVFMAAGAGVREGMCIEGAHIGDLAPTLLYFLGQPVLADMDGRVLREMFTEGFWAQNRLTFREPLADDDDVSRPSVPYSPAEASRVHERLKGLGYIG